MPTFSVAEAKNNLSKLIDLALKGEKVTITRHGVAVVDFRAVNEAAPPRDRKPDLEWLEKMAIKPSKPLTEDAGTLVSRMRDEEWER